MIRKRIAVLVGLLIIVSLAAAGPVLAAAPTNDTLGGAADIASLPFNATLDTSEATTDSDDVDINAQCGAPATDASVWYTITPAANGAIAVDVSGSNYSAGVIVASGTSGNWTVEACGPGATAWLTTSGVTYTILIFDDQQDGSGNGGNLVIKADEIPPPPEISLTVNPRGIFDSHTGGARVNGTVTCTGGPTDFSFIDVFMRQKTGRLFIDGEGFIEGFDCDGSTQNWTVDIFPFNGVFKGGRTATVTFAVACGEFLCGVGFDESVVSLSAKKK
jgi:hypothetical protein